MCSLLFTYFWGSSRKMPHEDRMLLSFTILKIERILFYCDYVLELKI